MLKIEFATENATFEEGQEAESAHLIREVARLVDDGYREGPIHDSNGNTVGAWSHTIDARSSR